VGPGLAVKTGQTAAQQAFLSVFRQAHPGFAGIIHSQAFHAAVALAVAVDAELLAVKAAEPAAVVTLAGVVIGGQPFAVSAVHVDAANEAFRQSGVGGSVALPGLAVVTANAHALDPATFILHLSDGADPQQPVLIRCQTGDYGILER